MNMKWKQFSLVPVKFHDSFIFSHFFVQLDRNSLSISRPVAIFQKGWQIVTGENKRKKKKKERVSVVWKFVDADVSGWFNSENFK